MFLPADLRLGSFEIVRLLGAGGMGQVYLARDRDLNRSVAVKVLPAEVTTQPQRLARFEQEARAASTLSHPNICHIYHLGETPDRQRYIAMEYVDGETLAQRLTGSRLTLRDVLDIAIQIAAALTAAHAAGIVHRDVKPENVMIRPDRLVKVLDFGLAKLMPSAIPFAPHGSTATVATSGPGSLVGTTDYMSPEQARGHDVDARTDIWALGVVLYEMVAGRAPFTGTSRSDVLVAILDREPAPLARFSPQVPAELQRIVGKALRKDPERRYQVMKDLLLDLEALRDEVASSDRSQPSAEASTALLNEDMTRPVSTGKYGVSRRPVRTLITVASAAVILLALIGAAWWASRSRVAPIPESAGRWNYPYTRLTSGAGLQTDPTFSPDGKFIAYASDRTGNFDIWVQPLSGGDPVQVSKSPADDTQPAWSPDGTTLVFRSERGSGGLFLVPAFGGAERQLTSFGSHPMWSVDGSEILFFAGRYALYRRPGGYLRLHAVALDGQPPLEILRDFLRDGWWIWAASHPDGRISVIGNHRTRGHGFFTVSRNGDQVTTSKLLPFTSDLRGEPFRFQGAVPFRFQWNAAGTMLYFEAAAQQTRSLWRVTVDPATLDWLSAERLTTPAGRDIAPTLSRDGTRIAFSQQNEASRLVAFPLGMVANRPRVVGEGTQLTEEGAVASMPSLSPDGSKLAHELTRPGIDRSEVWIMDIDGGGRELIATNGKSPIWSRDGTRVAYTYVRGDTPPFKTAVAYRRLGGTERFLTPWSSRFTFVPGDWTPDNNAVLGEFMSLEAGTPPTSVSLWSTSNPRAEQPQRILLSSPAGAQIWCSTFSPDARWILFTVLRVGQDRVEPSLELAVARPGTPPEQWVRIAPDHEWPDKPRWGSDGKTIFFISKGSTSHLNLWAAQFDPERGKPIGEPFPLTHFDSPKRAISPYIDQSYLAMSPRHAVVQMMTVSGSVWMLENVDR